MYTRGRCSLQHTGRGHHSLDLTSPTSPEHDRIIGLIATILNVYELTSQPCNLGQAAMLLSALPGANLRLEARERRLPDLHFESIE